MKDKNIHHKCSDNSETKKDRNPTSVSPHTQQAERRRWTVEGIEGIPELLMFGFDDPRKAIPLYDHVHQDAFEFVYIEKGKASWETANERFETRAGDIFHTLPNEVHRAGYNVIEPSRIWWLIVQVPVIKGERRSGCSAETGGWLRLDAKEQEQLIQGLWSLPRIVSAGPQTVHQLRRIQRALQKQDVLSLLEARTAIVDFLLHLLRPESGITLASGLVNSINKLKQDMEARLNWNPSLRELAVMANVSPSHFHRAFQAYTGLTPKSYLERVKIAEACRMLKETGFSVTEIAFALGYATTQHFATAFRRHTGQTPTGWRRA